MEMIEMRRLGVLWLVACSIALSACGSGNAALKAAAEKEAAEKEAAEKAAAEQEAADREAARKAGKKYVPRAKPVAAPTASTTAPAEGVRVGYACCNLRYSGDWISDYSIGQNPFIAAGTPVTVKSIDASSNRAYIEADGKPLRLGHDYGRAQESTEQWVSKLIVADDPKVKLAKYSSTTQNAIREGKLMRGMTKEQVIMSVGYPPSHETPDLKVSPWKFYWSDFGPYYVHWSGNTVSKIGENTTTVNSLTYKGK